MRRLDEAFERREELRVSRRLSCALLAGGVRHEALVTDISVGSLLVHTEAELAFGSGVAVSLNVPDGGLMVLEARVRERRALPRSLSGAMEAGTVLRVNAPPPAWIRWVHAEIGKEA
jgi:PilZ domain